MDTDSRKKRPAQLLTVSLVVDLTIVTQFQIACLWKVNFPFPISHFPFHIPVKFRFPKGKPKSQFSVSFCFVTQIQIIWEITSKYNLTKDDALKLICEVSYNQ